MKYLSFLPDLMILAGLCGIFYGLNEYCPWIAYTITGALVFGVGVVMSWPKRPPD
jgi:hypothetical protein